MDWNTCQPSWKLQILNHRNRVLSCEFWQHIRWHLCIATIIIYFTGHPTWQLQTLKERIQDSGFLYFQLIRHRVWSYGYDINSIHLFWDVIIHAYPNPHHDRLAKPSLILVHEWVITSHSHNIYNINIWFLIAYPCPNPRCNILLTWLNFSPTMDK